jgi:hypothetical protein
MRPGQTRALALSLSLLLAGLPFGCGSGDEKTPTTLPVTGKVTYKGEPVTKGTITFQPDDGRPATGEIQPDGTYKLSTFADKDGAVPGHHKVMIVANTADPTKIPGSSPGYVAPKDLVPKKYGSLSTSGLEKTVSKDTASYDFDLK